MVLLNNNKNMSILSEFTSEELDQVIQDNPSLRGFLQGYLAEVALKKQLLQLPDVFSVEKIPDQAAEKGDLRVRYKDLEITIEVKSIGTNTVKQDVLYDSWQGTVAVRSSDKKELEVEGVGRIRTSSIPRGGFDILAISCYAVSGKWEFLFMDNDNIPYRDLKTPNLLKSSFTVNPETTPYLHSNLLKILQIVYDKKKSNC